MAATAIFALVYLGPRDTVDGTGTNIGNRLAHQVRLSADQSDVPALSCRIGAGPTVAAAAALSARKGLLIVGAIDGGEAVGRLHECLNGAPKSAPHDRHLEPERCSGGEVVEETAHRSPSAGANNRSTSARYSAGSSGADRP